MTLDNLKELRIQWLDESIEFGEYENALQEYYGIETYNKCVEFFTTFGDASLMDCLTF